MRDLPIAELSRDLGREVEIAVEQPPEVEPVEVLVEPGGIIPVFAVREEFILPGPQIDDSPQTPVKRPASGTGPARRPADGA